MNVSLVEFVVSVIVAMLASSGLWAFLQKRYEKKDLKTQMLLGIGHDLIISRGLDYIHRGWITEDEYENLHDYLYKPYAALGGNGTAKRVMDEVQKLELKHIPIPTIKTETEGEK